MNLLIENTPDYIVVRGIKLKIKTDFALWVKFLLAIEESNEDILTDILVEIFGEIPQNIAPKELVSAMGSWLFQCNEKADTGRNNGGKSAFDFNADGNIIFCELWQYFPQLMEKGISFPQGLELIKLLMQNEKTILSHRAFARCGDFSKLSKEQRSYWQKERSKYAIKMKQEEIDNAIASMF